MKIRAPLLVTCSMAIASAAACAGRPVRTEVIATEISNRLFPPPAPARGGRDGVAAVRDRARQLQDQLRAEKAARERGGGPEALGTSGIAQPHEPRPTAAVGTPETAADTRGTGGTVPADAAVAAAARSHAEADPGAAAPSSRLRLIVLASLGAAIALVLLLRLRS